METQSTLLELLRGIMNDTEEGDIYTDPVLFGENADKADPYIATSALHKEIRRRDFEGASYWAMILDRVRGRFYTLRYLANITTEETHSPYLKIALTKIMANYKTSSIEDILHAVDIFCRNKHWKYMTDVETLNWQYNSYIWKDIREHEKNKQRVLTPDPELVEKWKKKMTPSYHYQERGLYMTYELLALLEQSLEEKNLQNTLYVIHFCEDWAGIHKYTKELLVSDQISAELHKMLGETLIKKNTFWGFDYETLALRKMGLVDIPEDFLEGKERTVDEIKQRVADIHHDVAVNGLREYPKYALDSHTRVGRVLWTTRKKEISPNVPCEVMDLRFAAEWISIMWRREAYKQYKTIMVNWEDVALDEKLFYRALWKGIYPNG